jgi:hypothetical protein
MKEVISLEELPFTFPLLNAMKKDNLVIEKLKREMNVYYFLTSSKVHQVYSYDGIRALLLTEIHMFDLMNALEHPSFKKVVESYLGTTQNV